VYVTRLMQRFTIAIVLLRKVMMKKTYLFFLLLGLIGVGATEAQTSRQKIDSLISDYHEADCFNGVVLDSEKGEVILKKAYGIADRELNVAMTTGMKFRIASISKPFTAMVMLQLVDDGVIRLDGKITDMKTLHGLIPLIW